MQGYEDRSAEVDPGGKSLVGALIRFPVADGAAVYVVVQDEPLCLKHVPYGDAYEAAEATVRGVNKATVRAQLRHDQYFRGAKNLNESFYDSLKPGQIVHYHHSAGAFVRCVAAYAADPQKARTVLLPIALVGPWREYDLPRRLPNGEIIMGFLAEKVLSGEVMRPHESSIWESPRSPMKAAGVPDPTGLEPVSLEVPPMTEEQQHRAALWLKIEKIQSIARGDGLKETPDPEQVLADIARVLVGVSPGLEDLGPLIGDKVVGRFVHKNAV
jgi:hypothetical protein